MRDIETYVRVPFDKDPDIPFIYVVMRTRVDSCRWLLVDDAGGYKVHENYNVWDEPQWIRI